MVLYRQKTLYIPVFFTLHVMKTMNGLIVDRFGSFYCGCCHEEEVVVAPMMVLPSP
jgi:hypothetical protein